MSTKLIASCGVALLVLVTTPMWLIMLYMLLEATQQPSWVWGVYFAYAPLSFLAAILMGLGQTQTEEK